MLLFILYFAQVGAASADESLTGIDEIDCLSCGIAFGTVGRLSLFRTAVASSVASVPSMSWADLEERLVKGSPHAEADLARLQHYFLLYPEALVLDVVFDTLYGRVLEREDLALCAGKVLGKGVFVYIRRRVGTKRLPELIVDDAVPLHFQTRRGGSFSRTVDTTLECFSKCLSDVKTNLVMREPQGNFSFEQIVAATARLTQKQLVTLRGEASAVEVKQRSEFQSALLRVFGDLVRLRELDERNGNALVFNAFELPPSIKVAPLEHVNMNLKGSRLWSQSSSAWGSCSVDQTY